MEDRARIGRPSGAGKSLNAIWVYAGVGIAFAIVVGVPVLALVAGPTMALFATALLFGLAWFMSRLARPRDPP